jgi:hypothetical protein
MKYKHIKHHTYKYETTEDFTITLLFNSSNVESNFYNFKNYNLKILSGYKWDGCSGPSIDTSFENLGDIVYKFGDNMVAGIVHDCLYQMLRTGELKQCYKKAADHELRRLMVFYSNKGKVAKFRAWYHYIGVKIGGRFSCKPNSQLKNKMLYI